MKIYRWFVLTHDGHMRSGGYRTKAGALTVKKVFGRGYRVQKFLLTPVKKKY